METTYSKTATVLGAVATLIVCSSWARAQDRDEGVISPNALGETQEDLLYTPVTPCRIIDTRLAGGPLAAGTPREFLVVGGAHQNQGGTLAGCGIPSGATSAVLNFLSVSPAGLGHFRAWAYSTPPVPAPNAAILNYNFNPDATLNLANGIPVPICDPTLTSCPFDLRVQAFGGGTHLVVDVLGYFNKFPPVQDADVAAAAAIAESKLALNFPTHTNTNDPTAAEKAALAGTSSAPGAANAYVTNADARNTNARVPLVHGDALHDATVASLDGTAKVPVAELGTGTASASTFLRGDRTWSAPPAAPHFIDLQLFGARLTGGAVFTFGSGSNAGLQMPDAGVPALDLQFKIPLDYNSGAILTLRVIWHTGATSCTIVLPPNYISVARVGRTHIVGPGGATGFVSVGGDTLNAPATANQSQEKLYTISSPVPAIPLQAGDTVIFGLFRFAFTTLDTCAANLTIQSASVTY